MLSGKGGVGKSTVSGMLGWALSHDEEVMVRRSSSLVVSSGVDVAHSESASRRWAWCHHLTQADALFDPLDWIDGHRYMWSLPPPHVRCRLANAPLNLSRLAPPLRPPQPFPNLHRLSPPLHFLSSNLARSQKKRDDQTIPSRCRLGRPRLSRS